MAAIEFKSVTKSFDNNVVIRDINLKIEDGLFTVLVGPSGCGKTTLLRMIAGIGPQTSGKVLIDGQDVSEIAPGKRGVAMVFQNYAIYPTMTVRENIEFGLKNNKIPKDVRKQLIEEASDKVGLSQFLDRMPSTLSGGQRQRVALARAMVKKPSVFLMDEPLSNLDAKLRVQMRVELIELHKKLQTTFVYVTHDQVEAMSMADTVILMNNGLIQQIASPEEIYSNPANLFTARFIGSPAMNIVALQGGNRLGFRPERGILTREKRDSGVFHTKGIVVTREMLGRETTYSVRDKMGRTYMVTGLEDPFRVDDTVFLSVDMEHIYFFGKDETRIRPGDEEYDPCLELLRRDV
ncbi:ABC transporter ATP-binding protein [Hungatella effluvii]|uniref:ABC transporter ATP-binding protein n=1 Tax=Hungatella effluvii TaxID=1096246 RepID=UPI002A81CF25|nr:ABC transporter ATP-binding protein [Hungatella effluvii]